MDKNRNETDQSLRNERIGADGVLRNMQDAEVAADKVVDLARQHADAVLVVARGKADQESEQSRAIELAVVDEDRRQADQVLLGERAAADERLHRQREDYVHALAKLLPLERENTDRALLTERVRSDEAIANRDDFLGVVCHDLRNLLGGIVISSSVLSENASGADVGDRILLTGKRIQIFAARMNRLIGDLVDVVSLDAGKLTNTIVSSDPLALISETKDLFQGAAKLNGITLESEVAGPLPRAAFDHERMLQVFANLITNAIKFSPPGGKIRLRGERDGDAVHFSVSDSGTGIPVSMLEDVFKRFWQADQKDRRGVGLGLYIAKSIVEAHKGRIWIESKVGQGSTFHFTVPVADGASALPESG